jgi:SAM-dependent methyltransferase
MGSARGHGVGEEVAAREAPVPSGCDAGTVEEPWESTHPGSAPFYREGRLPYAPGMARALARALQLDGRGRLLDVGCGPGIIALDVVDLFEEVVGIDADPAMITEAEAEASRRGVENSRWRCLRAEQMPDGLGTFRVAALAQSFHWMDRERVVQTLHAMIEPDGALVHINAYTRLGVVEATRPHPLPQPPWNAISELVGTYLGSETLPGQDRRDAVFGSEEEIYRQWFAGPEVVKVPDGRVLTRTIDQVVAAVYSVSTSSPETFGERRHAFESDLRALLRETSATATFSQETGATDLRIWRPNR